MNKSRYNTADYLMSSLRVISNCKFVFCLTSPYLDGHYAFAEDLDVQRIPGHHQLPSDVADLAIRLDPFSLNLHDVLVGLVTNPAEQCEKYNIDFIAFPGAITLTLHTAYFHSNIPLTREIGLTLLTAYFYLNYTIDTRY